MSVCAEKRGPEEEVEGGMGRMGNGDVSGSLSRYRCGGNLMDSILPTSEGSCLSSQQAVTWRFPSSGCLANKTLRQMTLNYSSYFWINGCRSDSVLRVLHLIPQNNPMMGDTFSSFCSWAREVINLQSFQSCGVCDLIPCTLICSALYPLR